MCFIFAAALVACGGGVTPRDVTFAGESPLTETVLAGTRGAGLTRGSLSTAMSEQAAVEQQLVSDAMRANIDNWFADSNVQLIGNAALTGG